MLNYQENETESRCNICIFIERDYCQSDLAPYCRCINDLSKGKH